MIARKLYILGLSLLTASCAHAGLGAGFGQSNGVLRIGTAISPNTLNPILVTELAENNVETLIFNGLTEEDDRNAIQPDLATVVPTLQNGGISKDGKTILYHLRKGVSWQDGAPFTSEDVKFTWEAVMNRKNNAANVVPYDEVASVDTPDRYTVVFRMKRPFAPFVAEAFNSATVTKVVPAHLLRKYPDVNHIPFNYAPIGTGPYRVLSWKRGDRITLQANPRYFKGAPKIPQITVLEIPQENTGINELRSKDLDIYLNISETSYNIARGSPDIRLIVTPANSYRALYMNNERPALRDARVRRALTYAIDKKTMVQKVTHGTGTVATGSVPNFMWAYDNNVPITPYDPAKARALLLEAGWTLGPDGVLQKNGQPLSFVLTLRQGAAGDTAMAVMVQAYLREVGIKTEIKSYPGSTLFAVGSSGIMQPGKYDLNISGFSQTADPDNSAELTCANRPPNGFNWTRFCDPQLDALEAQAVGTYDQRKRKAVYDRIQELTASEAPYDYFYYQPNIDAVNPALKNIKPSMLGPMWNAHEWSF